MGLLDRAQTGDAQRVFAGINDRVAARRRDDLPRSVRWSSPEHQPPHQGRDRRIAAHRSRHEAAVTKVVLFELPAQAAELETDLRPAFPGRDLTIWPGDCNQTIDAALAALAPLNYAATFAFVDQYAAEVEWATLQTLAAFKAGKKTKVELWLLFAHSMLPRGLAADSYDAFESFAARIDAMYGSRDWEPIYDARQAQALTAAELRNELTNLMRWRLENVLGYARTHAFEMKNTHGTPIYSMIFATDHAAGDKIMSHIYGKAADKRPLMQAEAAAKVQAEREAKDGVWTLIPPLPKKIAPDKLYVHEPPTVPYGMELADPEPIS